MKKTFKFFIKTLAILSFAIVAVNCSESTDDDVVTDTTTDGDTSEEDAVETNDLQFSISSGAVFEDNDKLYLELFNSVDDLDGDAAQKATFTYSSNSWSSSDELITDVDILNPFVKAYVNETTDASSYNHSTQTITVNNPTNFCDFLYGDGVVSLEDLSKATLSPTVSLDYVTSVLVVDVKVGGMLSRFLNAVNGDEATISAYTSSERNIDSDGNGSWQTPSGAEVSAITPHITYWNSEGEEVNHLIGGVTNVETVRLAATIAPQLWSSEVTFKIGNYSFTTDISESEIECGKVYNLEIDAISEDYSVVDVSSSDKDSSSADIFTTSIIGDESEYSVSNYPVAVTAEEIESQVIEGSYYVDVTDFGTVGDGITEDSDAFQNAINEVAAQDGGGVVYVPEGTYYITYVDFYSNVHMHVEPNVTFRIAPSNQTSVTSSKLRMFRFGDTYNAVGQVIENVVLKSTVEGQKFTIDITGETAAHRVFLLKDVKNFIISDFIVYNNQIKFPIMTFAANDEKDPDIFGPTNGIVRNAYATDCHYGYGLTQVQTGKKLYFENVGGQGGVTARYETGSDVSNSSQFGGVFDCYAKDVYCENGNAAVMISPHSLNNGVVQVDGVTAVSCAIGVRIDGGYASTYTHYETGDDVYIDNIGIYEDGSYVTNVHSTYGTDAQLKSKHAPYMPDEIYYQYYPFTYVSNICEPAPSVCAVLYKPTYEIGLWNVTAVGYVNDAVVTAEVATR